MTAGGGATRFVGRERELEAILDAAAEALAGRSGTVLLEASSGMGATRLIDEVLGHLAADPPAGAGAPVVIRADELPAWRRASYAPFRVALEGLLDARTDEDAMHVLGSGEELLLPLLPRAAARLAPAHPGPGTRERLPDRIHEAVRGVVCRLAAYLLERDVFRDASLARSLRTVKGVYPVSPPVLLRRARDHRRHAPNRR